MKWRQGTRFSQFHRFCMQKIGFFWGMRFPGTWPWPPSWWFPPQRWRELRVQSHDQGLHLGHLVVAAPGSAVADNKQANYVWLIITSSKMALEHMGFLLKLTPEKKETWCQIEYMKLSMEFLGCGQIEPNQDVGKSWLTSDVNSWQS